MDATTDLEIRKAERADLQAIIAIFAADEIGAHNDTSEPEAFDEYLAAFASIEASPLQTLYVARLGNEVVGTFQTTLLTSLPGRGKPRLLVEAVQTRDDMRGRGIGARMMGYAVARAREQGVAKVQLSSNATRIAAHRFYERLGFVRSHLGFHMPLK